MNISMEKWAKRNLSDTAVILMNESLICYKVGAYRSAYLMSYLAFKQTLRARILNSRECPSLYKEVEWERNVLKKLRDDDKWEEIINDIVMANPESRESGKLASIFKFTNRERTLNRYIYWKNIRNSCAHAKDEHINSATVEQFWNYMQDDMSEFYVLGGKQYLINELVDRYRYYVSDENKDLSQLLGDINIVYKNEMKEFFTSFLDKLISEDRWIINDRNDSFWRQIINFEEEELIKSFVLSLVEKREIFIDFFKYHNNILSIIHQYDSRFIQDYINQVLQNAYYDDSYGICFWKLMSNVLLLNHQSIDIDSITSKYENFKLIEYIDISTWDAITLNKHNVFKKFIINAGGDLFKNDSNDHWNYYSYNSNKDDKYIVKYFEYIEWDIDLIEKIDSSLGYLKENITSRSNIDSICNGKTRINTYELIINNSNDRIKSFFEENNINIEECTNIKEIIS